MAICVSITLYHGYECTNKFISNPATITEESVQLEEMHAIQWTLCQQFTIGDCIFEEGGYFSLFGDSPSWEPEG